MWMSFCERKFPQSKSNTPWAVVCQEQKVSGGGEVSAGRLDECHTSSCRSWYGRLLGGITAVSLLWPERPTFTRPERQTQPLFHDENNSKNVVLVLSPRVSLWSVRSVLVTKGYSCHGGALVSVIQTLLMHLKLVRARNPDRCFDPTPIPRAYLFPFWSTTNSTKILNHEQRQNYEELN